MMFVIYTKSLYERKVADGLVQKGRGVIHRTKRKWSDWYKLLEKPLFRSYRFVRLAKKERNQFFGVLGVVCYFFWLGRQAVIEDEEIEGLRKMLSGLDHEYIAVRQFEINDRIKVKGAPSIP